MSIPELADKRVKLTKEWAKNKSQKTLDEIHKVDKELDKQHDLKMKKDDSKRNL